MQKNTTRSGQEVKVGDVVRVYNLRHLRGWCARKRGTVVTKSFPFVVQFFDGDSAHLYSSEFKILGRRDEDVYY